MERYFNPHHKDFSKRVCLSKGDLEAFILETPITSRVIFHTGELESAIVECTPLYLCYSNFKMEGNM